MAHTHGTEAETRKIGSLQLSPTYWNFVLEIKPLLGILIPPYRTQDFTTPCWLGCFPHSVTTQANNLDPNTSLRGTEHNHLLLGGKDSLLQLTLLTVHQCAFSSHYSGEITICHLGLQKALPSGDHLLNVTQGSRAQRLTVLSYHRRKVKTP